VIIWQSDLSMMAAPAVPVLIGMLKDPGYHSPGTVMEALTKIGASTPETWDAIISVLGRTEDQDTRSSAAKALFHVVASGPVPEHASEVFKALLTDSNPEVNYWARWALKYLA